MKVDIRFVLFAVVSIVLYLQACDGPECRNENQIFSSKSFDSKVYQQELAAYLKTQDKNLFSYWVDGYIKNGDQSSIIVSIRGKEFCAKGILEIPESGPLTPIIRTKGVGFIGAELAGLNFDLKESSEGLRLIYKDVDEIED